MEDRRLPEAFAYALILCTLVLYATGQPTPPATPPSGTPGSGTSEMREINDAVLQTAAGLAVLLIAIHGVKWITSDNPQDRADVKKGLTYVILGLLMAYLAKRIVEAVYCYAIYKSMGVDIAECTSQI